MKQHGMLFKAEMVNAISRDIDPKRMTRRNIEFHNSITEPHVRRDEWDELRFGEGILSSRTIVVPNPDDSYPHIGQIEHIIPVWHVPFRDMVVKVLPRVRPGDIIWVKETWRPCGPWESKGKTIQLKADGIFHPAPNSPDTFRIKMTDGINKWRSSMLMPRWASRTDLPVLRVGSQRIQEISEDDAKAEGWIKRADISDDPQVHIDAARDWFMDLWDSINAAKGFGWNVNHPVWSYAFERQGGKHEG